MPPQGCLNGCNSGSCHPLEDYIRLPKVELHAHFFGSIRLSSVHRIAESKKLADYPNDELPGECPTETPATANASFPLTDSPDLAAAFNYFSWVYSVVRTARDVRQALLEVLEDFHNDNVVYLELRSVSYLLATGATQQLRISIGPMARGPLAWHWDRAQYPRQGILVARLDQHQDEPAGFMFR